MKLAKEARKLSKQLFRDSFTEGALDAEKVKKVTDLVIRTSGEMRVSNFLLWQISYAEIWVTPVAWPEFEERHLDEALAAFASRDRRFGGLAPS